MGVAGVPQNGAVAESAWPKLHAALEPTHSFAGRQRFSRSRRVVRSLRHPRELAPPLVSRRSTSSWSKDGPRKPPFIPSRFPLAGGVAPCGHGRRRALHQSRLPRLLRAGWIHSPLNRPVRNTLPLATQLRPTPPAMQRFAGAGLSCERARHPQDHLFEHGLDRCGEIHVMLRELALPVAVGARRTVGTNFRWSSSGRCSNRNNQCSTEMYPSGFRSSRWSKIA